MFRLVWIVWTVDHHALRSVDNLRAENINSSDVTTSQLRLVNFGTPGYFEIEEAATTMVEPLITSTEASGPFDAESVRRNPQPAEILKEFRPQNKTYLLQRGSAET